MQTDSLQEWLRAKQQYDKIPAEERGTYAAEVHEVLDRLEKWLDNPSGYGDMANHSEILDLWRGDLSASQVVWAQRLYCRVVEQGGRGSISTQEYLLRAIVLSLNLDSIPFLLDILDLRRKREQSRYVEQRRASALAGLALMALYRNQPEPYEALQQAMYHHDAQVRALAVHYLGRAYYDAEINNSSGEVLRYHYRDRYLFEEPHQFRAIPEKVLAQLAEIAELDDAFAPRFQAREILKLAGKAVPFDHPNGTYAFKVKFMSAKRIYRTIEMRSEQTLDALHLAIQEAIDWDGDHLYFFSLDGSEENQLYRFASPWEQDKPFANEAIIGQMGFVKKQKFLYYLDYRATHRFEVEVLTIRPKADHGTYPRLINSKGDAPRQYNYPHNNEKWW